MRTELMALRLAVLVLATAVVGCGGSNGLSCGPGTHLLAGKCLPNVQVDACGPGTAQHGLECLPIGPDAGGDGSAPDVGPDTTADGAANPDTAADTGLDASDVPADVSAATCDPACSAAATCVDGVCEPMPIPATWTCAKKAWADGATCDCGCGAVDPDCAAAPNPVVGCKSGKCKADGTCEACTPQCSGKECGDDGCGSLCGICDVPGKPSCVGGTCQACAPDCAGKACGPDGCGGQCGSCGPGLKCAFDQCIFPPAEESCLGHCGGYAPSGCACNAACAGDGSCCVDVGLCGCLPKCGGLACGDDGCGGSCGECAAGSTCVAGACLLGVCTDATCNSHGSCLPATATCTCDAGYAGPFCDACAQGFVGFPSCVTPCDDVTQCDDGNACTSDDCSASNGCVHLAIAVTCDDGDACTVGDFCTGGLCNGGAPLDCNDNNACTADSCTKAAGCAHLPSGATSCDDGNACTTGDACSGATCQGGTPTVCDDGNACTGDACDPGSGCAHTPNGALCSLADPCSAGGACDGAICKSLGTKSCDDGNPCTVDACDSSSGTCTNLPAAASTACDDDDPCTAGDVCDGAGKCAPGVKICALTVTSGLAAHYTAGVGASLAYGADQGVAIWHDLSGHQRDLSAADGSQLPLLDANAVHGRRGLRFSGSSGLGSAAFDLASEASVFAVICTDAGGALGPIASHGSSATDWALEQDKAAVGTGVRFASVGADSSDGQALEPGHCYVLAGRTSASLRGLLAVETLSSEAGGSGGELTAASKPLHVGTNDVGAASSAVIGELLYYQRYVSDAERDSITTYLRTAWNFAPPKPDFAWFDAADLATVVTATDGSGNVLTWKDKSGLGRDASAGSDTPPLWYENGTSNGRPAVRFAGGDVRLQTGVVPSSPQMTVFAVFEMDAPQSWGSVFNQGHDTWFSIRKTETVPASLNWHIANNNDAPVLPLALGSWGLMTAVQDATTSTAYTVPGAPQTFAQGPIAAGNAKLSLGNSFVGNESMGGFVAEIRAYASALSPTDRAYVESLLRTKYGL